MDQYCVDYTDIGPGACTQDLCTVHTTQNAVGSSIPTAFCSMCRLTLKHQVEALDRKIWSEKHVMLERKQQLAWMARFILLSMRQAMNPALKKQLRRVPFLKVLFGCLTRCCFLLLLGFCDYPPDVTIRYIAGVASKPGD